MSEKFCRWGGGSWTFLRLKSNIFDFETVNLPFLDGDVPIFHNLYVLRKGVLI